MILVLLHTHLVVITKNKTYCLVSAWFLTRTGLRFTLLADRFTPSIFEMGSSAWVIVLEGNGDEAHIQKGFLLATSLRRVKTSKEIIVLVKGQELSATLKKRLLADGLTNHVSLISSSVGNYKDILDQNQILHSFRNLVFLPVGSIVLVNCDKIMENKTYPDKLETGEQTENLGSENVVLISRENQDFKTHLVTAPTYYSCSCVKTILALDYKPSILYLHGSSIEKAFDLLTTDGSDLPEKWWNKPLLQNNEENTLSQMCSSRPLHAIALQAPTSQQLTNMIEKLSRFLVEKEKEGQVDCSFANLAYTLNKSTESSKHPNNHHQHRAMLIAKDWDEARKLLSKPKGYLACPPSKRTCGKLCFLFTGMGCQSHGMAKSLYSSCPVFRLTFDKCSHLLQSQYGIDINSIIWGEESSSLNRTLYSPPAIFSVQYSLLQVWLSWGITPDYVLGHSLGEVAAAIAAGAVDLEDGIKLVAERARLSDELSHGKMLVIKRNEREVEEMLSAFSENNNGLVLEQPVLDFAAVNSPEQTVLAGDADVVEEFAEFSTKQGMKTIVLDATHAFHSRHMDPMLEEYRRVVNTCKGDLTPVKCKYISGCTGKVENGPLDANYWAMSNRDRVRFMEGMKTALDEGCRIFLEIGPHPVLCTLAKAICNDGGIESETMFLPSIRRGGDDWKTMMGSLAKLWVEAGLDVDWNGIDKYFKRELVVESIIKELLSTE